MKTKKIFEESLDFLINDLYFYINCIDRSWLIASLIEVEIESKSKPQIPLLFYANALQSLIG